ncbi:hypothetical protein M0804_010778 [Polistes exclamans]|nr:hypothetical protein M0804_010778 [Polistes exclamans]
MHVLCYVVFQREEEEEEEEVEEKEEEVEVEGSCTKRCRRRYIQEKVLGGGLPTMLNNYGGRTRLFLAQPNSSSIYDSDIETMMEIL